LGPWGLALPPSVPQGVDPGRFWASHNMGTTHGVCIFQNDDVITLVEFQTVLWE
jgi:hypothetical protein